MFSGPAEADPPQPPASEGSFRFCGRKAVPILQIPAPCHRRRTRGSDARPPRFSFDWIGFFFAPPVRQQRPTKTAKSLYARGAGGAALRIPCPNGPFRAGLAPVLQSRTTSNVDGRAEKGKRMNSKIQDAAAQIALQGSPQPHARPAGRQSQ